MTSTNNQNIAPKKLTMNSETFKASDNIEPLVQDPLVTQIGNCFEKFADTLGQHMTKLGNQISKTVIDAMKIFDNPTTDKEEETKKLSHSSRAKACEEDEEHNRRKRQKLINNSCRDKSQIQEKRKVREINSSESSEDDQISCQNDDNEEDYLSLLSENQMDRKVRELHSSLQVSSDEEPPFKDYTKVLKDTGKKSGPTNKNLPELINTLW